MGHIPMHRQKCFSQICLATPTPGTFWVVWQRHSHSTVIKADAKKLIFSTNAAPADGAGRSMADGRRTWATVSALGATGCWAEGDGDVRKGWCPEAGSEETVCSGSADPHGTEWGLTAGPARWDAPSSEKPEKQDFNDSRISPLSLKRHWFCCYNLFLPENNTVWTLSSLKIKVFKSLPPYLKRCTGKK